MNTVPHVPMPLADQIGVALAAMLLGAVVALGLRFAIPRLRVGSPLATWIAGVLVAFVAFQILVQVRATDRWFGGYFSSKTPYERYRDHWADFEEQVLKDPDVRRAVGDFPDASAALQSLAKRGVLRLDDSTLKERSRLKALLASRLDVQACACLHGYQPVTEAQQRSIEHVMVELGADFGSRWMKLLHAQMLAEARGTPVLEPTEDSIAAASRVLEERLGSKAAARVAVGLTKEASPTERCWAVMQLYAAVEAIPEPHASTLRRVLILSGAD